MTIWDYISEHEGATFLFLVIIGMFCWLVVSRICRMAEVLSGHAECECEADEETDGEKEAE